MDYLKYYNLENYLFKEVRNNFKKRGYLTPDDFFCIVIWKHWKKRETKKMLLAQDKNLKNLIKKITNEIFRTKENTIKLEILLKYGFRLPTATAILTVLYPENFTVYDRRVRAQLGIERDFSERKDCVRIYFNKFLPKVKKFAESKNLSLRDADRYLWGKSFYKDLKKFLKQ